MLFKFSNRIDNLGFKKMISFVIGVTLLIITPGPGVLSVAGTGSSFGFQTGFRYIVGLFLGNNLVSLLVITGLAPMILSYPFARSIMILLSAAFLLYLAYKIAAFGLELAFIKTKLRPGTIAGIVFQLVNPKAYAVNTAIFSGFALTADSFLYEVVIKLLIYNLIWLPILSHLQNNLTKVKASACARWSSALGTKYSIYSTHNALRFIE